MNLKVTSAGIERLTSAVNINISHYHSDTQTVKGRTLTLLFPYYTDTDEQGLVTQVQPVLTYTAQISFTR